jgi:hypothetical protein
VPQGDDLVEVTYEGSASPRELLENIVIQAQAALKGLQTSALDAGVLEGLSEEDMKMMTKAEVDKIKKDTEDRQRGEAWNAMQAFWYVLWQSNIGPVELMNSNTILSAARTIDISLKETKGAEFVKRMQASLPRLPDAQGHALMAEEKQGLSSV